MATIKSYSDLQQSKKLAEILPLESADMEYLAIKENGLRVWDAPFVKDDSEVENSAFSQIYNRIPCWSLAALLSVLPFHLIVSNQRYAFSMHKGLNKDGETYVLRYNVFNTDVCLYITDYYDNPVDACVAMIEKLNELKML